MTASQNAYRFYRHVTAVMSIGGTRFLIDPMYAIKGRFPPVPSVFDFGWNPAKEFPGPFPELNGDSVLLITHHHFDHFDRAASAMIDKNIRVVTPENGVRRLKRHGFANISPLRAGQKTKIDKIEIEAIPVQHTQRCQRLLYKQGVGYLLRSQEKTAYISGDTVLFDRLYDYLRGVQIHLAVLYGGGARIPFLGKHTFSHHEVMELIRIIQPDLTLVAHLDCLNHCMETGNRLEERLKGQSGNMSIRIPKPGCEYRF